MYMYINVVSTWYAAASHIQALTTVKYLYVSDLSTVHKSKYIYMYHVYMYWQSITSLHVTLQYALCDYRHYNMYMQGYFQKWASDEKQRLSWSLCQLLLSVYTYRLVVYIYGLLPKFFRMKKILNKPLWIE